MSLLRRKYTLEIDIERGLIVDVNCEGVVTSVDAALILQLVAGLVGSLPNEPSADVNGDGDITSVDAALILQLQAGFIDSGDLNCP